VRFCKIGGICLAEELLACQEGLYPVQLRHSSLDSPNAFIIYDGKQPLQLI